jgi:polyferredoxin
MLSGGLMGGVLAFNGILYFMPLFWGIMIPFSIISILLIEILFKNDR